VRKLVAEVTALRCVLSDHEIAIEQLEYDLAKTQSRIDPDVKACFSAGPSILKAQEPICHAEEEHVEDEIQSQSAKEEKVCD
jgi:hypothetical protein